MPDREVKTIQDLIYYQYAKIIVRRASGATDGKEAKAQSYGLIKNKFRELKTGKISWSEITREDKQLVEAEKCCIYCGSPDDLNWEHIVPKSLKILPRCPTCETIQEIHNQIWACSRCNSMKSAKGLYHFFKDKYPGEKKFYDLIPPLLEKKYLKTIYNCHACAGTLNAGDIDGDGELTVLDIDHIIS
jgi:ribosomal protein S27AE